MPKQLLIYERAVPVNTQRHRDWSIKVGKGFNFVRNVNSIPLTAVEFPSAARGFAIVFAGTEDAMMPSVILGPRDQENLYLADDGTWRAKYVPAFLRRYPFVFSSGDDGQKFTLCIDEEFDGFNQEGLGERMFDAQGEQTQYLGNVLEFLKAYQTEFARTQAFCKKLKELELLEPMQARFKLGDGKQYSLSGFVAINRERLQNLSGETLASLARTGELEIAYLHLQSLRNLSDLGERLQLQVADGEVETGQDRAEAETGTTELSSDTA